MKEIKRESLHKSIRMKPVELQDVFLDVVAIITKLLEIH